MKDQMQRALDELEAQEILAERAEEKCQCIDCQNSVFTDWSHVSERLGDFHGGYCSVADSFIARDDSAISMDCSSYYDAE